MAGSCVNAKPFVQHLTILSMLQKPKDPFQCKDASYQCRKSHSGYKKILRPYHTRIRSSIMEIRQSCDHINTSTGNPILEIRWSYDLHCGIFYTSKMASLYWNRFQQTYTQSTTHKWSGPWFHIEVTTSSYFLKPQDQRHNVYHHYYYTVITPKTARNRINALTAKVTTSSQFIRNWQKKLELSI